MKKLFAVIILFCLFNFTNKPVKNNYNTVTFVVKANNEDITLFQITDEKGIPQYYYTDIYKYPCKGEKECKLMNLRMYWDAFGNYLTFELRDEVGLTKINHKPFTTKNYIKLHKILNNADSELQYCDYENLTSKETENQYHFDAISGATNTDFTFDYINGAIKTTYALWQMAQGDLALKINELTNQFCKQQIVNPKFSIKEYKEANTLQKFLFLNSLQSKDKILSNDDITILLNDLDTENYAIYTAILISLQNHKAIENKQYKNKIIPYLESNQFKQIKCYNILQNSGEHRIIKKKVLNFKKIEF
jgi:hypothetical protein